jgi:type II secretory pathway component PulM
MQLPSDPHPHAHPQPESGAHAHDHAHDHDHDRAPGVVSLFLAGSRERLMTAGGVVVLLWCLVWWALY